MNALGHHPVQLLDAGRCTSCALCAKVCPDAVFTVIAHPHESARDDPARPGRQPRGSDRESPDLPDRVLLKGNEAIAEAAIQAGCDAYFGYPITPQAEILEWMARRMPEEGRAFVQAESELGAITWPSGRRRPAPG